MRHAHLFWLIALFSLFAPSFALASSFDDLERSDRRSFEKLLDQCIERYNRGKLDDAQALCEEAAEITPHPATTYVFARIKDKELSCDEAVSLYEKVIQEEGAGKSEQRWLEDNRESAQEHRDALGKCQATLTVACEKDPKGMVTIDGELAGPCGTPITTSPGKLEVGLWQADQKPWFKKQRLRPDKPAELKAKKTNSLPAPKVALALNCEHFPEGALIWSGDEILGVCPLSIERPAPGTRIIAKTTEGEEGVALVNEGDEVLTLAPVLKPTIECGTPEATLELSHPYIDTITATCAALQNDPPALPVGAYQANLSLERFVPASVELELTKEAGILRLPALDAEALHFVVHCADEDPSAIHITVGALEGACPMEGELPPGQYSVTASNPDEGEWAGTLSLSHGGANSLQIPQLDEGFFFAAAAITLAAGGAVIATAAALDVAGYDDLQRLKDLSDPSQHATLCPNDPNDCATEHSELYENVDDTILATRILYGVGITAAAVGVGMMAYDLFGEEEGPSTVQILPHATSESTGLGLRWTF